MVILLDIGKVIGTIVEKYSDLNLDINEVGSGGDDGYIYTLAVYVLHKADGTGTDTGKTLTIWKNSGDQYLIYRTCWNSDSQ